MEIGVIGDQTHIGTLQSRWIEGKAKEAFWSGLKTDGEAQYKVVTYRCQDCGFLESYAVDDAPAKTIFE